MSSPFPLKILFVCSRNRSRSLTAEEIFKKTPGLEARSAGTQPGARIVVTDRLLGWADVVVAMEKSHLARLHLKYPEAMRQKPAFALHLPDDFHFMQAELIGELHARMDPVLQEIGFSGT